MSGSDKDKERNIKNWVEVAKLAKKYNRPTSFGVAVQAEVNDGSFFVVVFDKSTKHPYAGGISAKEGDLKALEELKVLVERMSA